MKRKWMNGRLCMLYKQMVLWRGGTWTVCTSCPDYPLTDTHPCTQFSVVYDVTFTGAVLQTPTQPHLHTVHQIQRGGVLSHAPHPDLMVLKCKLACSFFPWLIRNMSFPSLKDQQPPLAHTHPQHGCDIPSLRWHHLVVAAKCLWTGTLPSMKKVTAHPTAEWTFTHWWAVQNF